MSSLVIKCPNPECGARNSAISTYCGACGTRLPKPPTSLVIRNIRQIARSVQDGGVPSAVEEAPLVTINSTALAHSSGARETLLAKTATFAQAGYRMVAGNETFVQMVKPKRFNGHLAVMFFIAGPLISVAFLPAAMAVGLIGLGICAALGITLIISYLESHDSTVFFYIDATGQVVQIDM